MAKDPFSLTSKQEKACFIGSSVRNESSILVKTLSAVSGCNCVVVKPAFVAETKLQHSNTVNIAIRNQVRICFNAITSL